MRVHEVLPSLQAAMASAGLAHAAAIEVNGLVFLSGLTAFDMSTGRLGEGPFRADAQQTIAVLRAVLSDIRLNLDNVIKVNAYLKEPGDFSEWNEIYQTAFRAPRPCRTSVGSPLVVGLIELDVVASLEARV